MPLSWEDVLEKVLSGERLGNHPGNDLRNPFWPNGGMNEPTSPLQLLTDHVVCVARSRAAHDLAARIASPSTGTNEDPDLLTLLHRRDADGRPAIRIVERLATRAPDESLAALGLLYMSRSDLEVMSKRLIHSGRVSVLDAEADTLSAAWEVVTRLPSPSRWERLDAMWNQARRASRMRRQRSAEAGPLPEDFDIALPECSWLEARPHLLAGAVAAGILTPSDVLLLVRTRVEGEPLAAMAKALGRPYDAVRMERSRAETALRSFARRYGSEGS
jgi:hypothetical protein